jgi:hypothetical protein
MRTGFLRRINKLLFHGIKPVFVFDGGAPALKRSTIVSVSALATRTSTLQAKRAALGRQSEGKRRLELLLVTPKSPKSCLPRR